MSEQGKEIGMIGLGVMGRNLVLNMADKGFSVVGYDKNPAQGEALRGEAEGRPITVAINLQQFVEQLRSPKTVMMMVPAGLLVDAVILDLLPHLQPGDLVIDGGNSHFKDTNRRQQSLAEKGIQLLGVGISGGEEGARNGPSIMPGGPEDGYARVQSIMEAISAHVAGQPCATYMGKGSAGHYVKMVHNGIEYGLMELIAECYDLMRRGMGMPDDEMSTVFAQWNRGEMGGYLLEITSHILTKKDDLTGKPLVDLILDRAKQKGTGKWSSQDAMELDVPVPTIDAAVSMRNLSSLEPERVEASRLLAGPPLRYDGDRSEMLSQMGDALHAAMIITYSQGMAHLRAASEAYGYGLKLEDVARIWRGGCIVRSALLQPIMSAFAANPDIPNLLVDRELSKQVMDRQPALRFVVGTAARMGLPMPGMMASLSYLDGYRSDCLPANLVQAQRDYFGAHSYERVDAKGSFHTHWE